jgi:Ser/Thr protein kinase RdoA (MazF antagonist)
LRRLLVAGEPLAESETPIEIAVLSKKHSVLRAWTDVNGEARSVILKQLDPSVAQRNRLVTNRWLPALGLQAAAPKLLAAVAAPDVESVWHVYADVGGVPLEALQSNRHCVSAAVKLIAELHTRSADHRLVGECRREGEDFGMHYFTTNVTDAANLLAALHPPAVRLTWEEAALRDRLRRRLDTLLEGTAGRTELMEQAGGPETMLHGDLWTSNVIVDESDASVRLIDWDHAGAGPVCYDLSTLLYRFGRAERTWILERYRTALARAGWHLPLTPELNVLCDTSECARYANRIIWPAIALLHEKATWALAELGVIEQWFEALEPVLDDYGAMTLESGAAPTGYPAGRLPE